MRLNAVLISVPSVVTAITHITAINPTSIPYSTKAAPSSFLLNCKLRRISFSISGLSRCRHEGDLVSPTPWRWKIFLNLRIDSVTRKSSTVASMGIRLKKQTGESPHPRTAKIRIIIQDTPINPAPT
jgi:hypothetical protein